VLKYYLNMKSVIKVFLDFHVVEKGDHDWEIFLFDFMFFNQVLGFLAKKLVFEVIEEFFHEKMLKTRFLNKKFHNPVVWPPLWWAKAKVVHFTR